MQATEAQNPNHLLDAVLDYMNLKNDAALARLLGIAPPIISKIRHYKTAVSPRFLLRLYDATGLSIPTLRTLLYTTPQPEQKEAV